MEWMGTITQIGAFTVLAYMAIRTPGWLREMREAFAKEQNRLIEEARRESARTLQMIRDDMTRYRADFNSHNKVIEGFLEGVPIAFTTAVKSLQSEVKIACKYKTSE